MALLICCTMFEFCYFQKWSRIFLISFWIKLDSIQCRIKELLNSNACLSEKAGQFKCSLFSSQRQDNNKHWTARSTEKGTLRWRKTTSRVLKDLLKRQPGACLPAMSLKPGLPRIPRFMDRTCVYCLFLRTYSPCAILHLGAGWSSSYIVQCLPSYDTVDTGTVLCLRSTCRPVNIHNPVYTRVLLTPSCSLTIWIGIHYRALWIKVSDKWYL